jgi:hypothetical protein
VAGELRTYRKWEAGAPQRSSTWNVCCFAQKFNISLDWLIAGDAAKIGRRLTEGKIAILPTRRRAIEPEDWCSLM